jgi:hypothetical protein
MGNAKKYSQSRNANLTKRKRSGKVSGRSGIFGWISRMSRNNMIVITVFVLVFASAGIIYNYKSKAAVSISHYPVSCSTIEHPSYNSCYYFSIQDECGWYNGHVDAALVGYQQPNWHGQLALTEQHLGEHGTTNCLNSHYNAAFRYYTGYAGLPASQWSNHYSVRGTAYPGERLTPTTGIPNEIFPITVAPYGFADVAAILDRVDSAGNHEVGRVSIACPIIAGTCTNPN